MTSDEQLMDQKIAILNEHQKRRREQEKKKRKKAPTATTETVDYEIIYDYDDDVTFNYIIAGILGGTAAFAFMNLLGVISGGLL